MPFNTIPGIFYKEIKASTLKYFLLWLNKTHKCEASF